MPEDTDVLVVGGGIVGCAAAYDLARFGVEVALVERRELNAQASGVNAGSLHVQLTTRYFRDEKPATVAGTVPALMPLAQEAVRVWEELAGELDGDIEFKVGGGLMVAETAAEMATLTRKAAMERAAGLEVSILTGADLGSVAPYLSDRVIGAEYCPGEGKVNPLLATAALARGAVRAGACIRRRTALLDLEHRRGGFLAYTSKGAMRCRRVVNAAGIAAPRVAAMVGVAVPGEVRPQHMNVTEAAPALLPHLVQHAGRGLTMKQAASGNVIIGGGLPARAAAALGGAHVLKESLEGNLWTARSVVPRVGTLNLLRAWAGQSLMTDGMPILGAVPSVPGFYLAVAANPGLTLGPVCARLLAEALSGRRPSLDLAPFSISRY